VASGADPHRQYSEPSEGAILQESLSIAFLLLIEKLTPSERGVFLLHEVFDYEYPKIAEFSAARQCITDGRPRFEGSPAQHRKLLEEFLSATSSGQLSNLVALVSEDVVFYSDGEAGRALRSIRFTAAIMSARLHILLNAFRDEAMFLRETTNPTLMCHISCITGAFRVRYYSLCPGLNLPYCLEFPVSCEAMERT
jgi:hypothetical protein